MRWFHAVLASWAVVGVDAMLMDLDPSGLAARNRRRQQEGRQSQRQILMLMGQGMSNESPSSTKSAPHAEPFAAARPGQ